MTSTRARASSSLRPSRIRPCADRPRHAAAAGAGAVDDDALIAQPLAAQLAGVDEPGERDGAGALDVVVERRQLLAIALEHGEGGVLGQVLPLDDRARIARLDRRDELVDELEVGLAAQASLAHAEVERVVDEVGAIGADVERRPAACGTG